MISFLLSILAVVVWNAVFALETAREPLLPFGDINLVVLTDDHSWIGGHGKNEPYLNADYGDVLSFYQHLKRYCEASGKDVWFVMNGDWIDGTSLSLDGDIQYLAPLIEKMPFDVVNTGNHELYKTRVLQEMRRAGGFIDWWGDRHLASNIVMAVSGSPLSNRFFLLEGMHSKVLVFGFIYHLEDPAPEVAVQDPAEVVREQWFIEALSDNPHSAVLVMAHMGTDDESIKPILNAIRRYDGERMPVQFVAGHTHRRRWSQIDNFATAVEAGRYLDTVGFISFPNVETVGDMEQQENATDFFRHEFVDANVDSMKVYLNMEYEFSTQDGRALTDYILRTKNELGLDNVLGCSRSDFFMNRSLGEGDSLWAVYRDHVVPSQVERGYSDNRVVFVSQASWRYDLFAGENTYDDVVAISPFNETVFHIAALPCDTVLNLNKSMNSDTTKNFYQALPTYILSGTVMPGRDCELYTHHFELNSILEHLSKLHPDSHFEVHATGMTSTTMWTNFFLSEWPCVGQRGVHTPRPHDFSVARDDLTNKWNIYILFTSAALVILLCCCWRRTTYVCFRYTMPTSDEEWDAFNVKTKEESDSP